jgi:hypothetical protein
VDNNESQIDDVKLPKSVALIIVDQRLVPMTKTLPVVRLIFNTKQDPKVKTETAEGESHNIKMDMAVIYIDFVIHPCSATRAFFTYHQTQEGQIIQSFLQNHRIVLRAHCA